MAKKGRTTLTKNFEESKPIDEIKIPVPRILAMGLNRTGKLELYTCLEGQSNITIKEDRTEKVQGENKTRCPLCYAILDGTLNKICADPSSPRDRTLMVCHCRECGGNFIVSVKGFYYAWKSKDPSFREQINEFQLDVIYPHPIDVEVPNKDLDLEIQIDYQEAAQIYHISPRGACALLRLALEKLMDQVKVEGKDLNDKIGRLLVERRLEPFWQQNLDLMRVVGNNAVHGGNIDLKDDEGIARGLFTILNKLAGKLVTEPKELGKMYERMVPKGVQKSIESRDKKIRGNSPNEH